MTRRAVALPALLGVVLSSCQSDRFVIGRFRDDACDLHADALLCSGFERTDLSDWTGTVVENTGQLEQTETRSHTGKGALHASSTGAESVAVVAEEFPAVTDGDLFLRAYLYVPEGPTETMNFMFLGDYATPDPFKGVDFNLENGALSIYVPESKPDRFTSTASVIPRDRWFCLQIDVTLSKDAGGVQIRVDGAVGLDQKGLDTRPAAGVHLLRAGVDWSSKQTAAFDIYMDDVVLATTPVACDE